MMFPRRLSIALACFSVAFVTICTRGSEVASSVWIKDTAHDTSAWPVGFTLPQPGSLAEVIPVNGSGTSSSDTDFDAVMRAKAGPNTHVYLGPGLFKTRGCVGSVFKQQDSPGFRLQDRSRLIGSGKGGYGANGTTLLLVACNDYSAALVVGANQFGSWDGRSFTYTTATDIWVTDLQVDCNAPELTKGPDGPFDGSRPWYIQGVQLWGIGRCHIERVHVKNAIGNDTTPPMVENFILCINTPPGTSTQNVIEDCSVTDFYNPNGLGTCSAISMNRWDENAGSIHGTIRNCTVILNGERGWGYGGEFAYNLSSAWGVVISQCIARGAQRGFNNDTFPNYFMSVAANDFKMPPGICYAMTLLKGNAWSRFYGNLITLQDQGSSGFLVDKATAGVNNMILDHNTVVAGGGAWTQVAWPYNLNDAYRDDLIPVNVHLEHNQALNTGASSRFATLTPAQVGYMSGNSVNGDQGLWPVPQPNLGWTYSPARADLLADGMVDIILQNQGDYISFYSMAGASAQSPSATDPNQQSGWRVVGTGDLNVDGKTDLILNHTQNGLGYWLMDGAVAVQSGTINYQGKPSLPGGTWQVVAVADFNGDGKPDLLMQDENTYLGVWHLNGTEISDTALLSRNYSGGLTAVKNGKKGGTIQGKWRAVGTGDFNNDGQVDILFQHDLESDPKTDGQLAVWFMNDVTVLGSALLDPVRPTDPKYRVVATGDFRRACSVDILLQRKSPRLGWGGALMMWSMDPVNRLRRTAETAVTVNVGLNNVVAPR